MPNVRATPVGGGWLEVRQNLRFTGEIEHVDSYPLGNTYFVKGGESAANPGSDSNSGRTKDKAFKTLSWAVSKADDWDRIIVLPSDNGSNYLVEAVQGVDDDNLPINITQRGLKILGGSSHPHTLGSPTIHTHVAASTILTINAWQVEIAGITWQNQAAGGRCIAVGSTASAVGWGKNYIHDCALYGVGTAYANVGIDIGAIGHGSIDTPYTVVERCYFLYCLTGIELSAGYGTMVRDSVFHVPVAGTGIFHSSNTADRPFTYYIDNHFSSQDSTNAIGINVYQTPNVGTLYAAGNHFAGFASDDKCMTKRTGYCGANWNGGALLTSVT